MVIDLTDYCERPYREALEAAKAELLEWWEYRDQRVSELSDLAEKLPLDSELRERLEKVAGDWLL
jgi:hypothetical protein